LPTKNQVKAYMEEGLHKIQSLLDPSDIWPLTRRITVDYDGIGIPNSAFSEAEITGYAQIISVLVAQDGINFKRATEVPAKDWDKSELSNSMYEGSENNPVFSFEDGKLVVAPSGGASVKVKINYIGTVTVDVDQSGIANVPKVVENVIVAHATKQAATMLAAHYAQEEDPISQSLMAIAQIAQQEYTDGFNALLRKSKIRGNIS